MQICIRKKKNKAKNPKITKLSLRLFWFIILSHLVLCSIKFLFFSVQGLDLGGRRCLGMKRSWGTEKVCKIFGLKKTQEHSRVSIFECWAVGWGWNYAIPVWVKWKKGARANQSVLSGWIFVESLLLWPVKMKRKNLQSLPKRQPDILLSSACKFIYFSD